MSPLPRFIVLKSVYNGKYLTKVTNEVSTQTKLPETFLSFHGEDITSPYARFEVETAKKNPELVHLRCCRNNKYLVRDQTGRSFIIAAADRPVEDVDIVSCSMFQPIQADDFKKEDHFRFLHVQSGYYACLSLNTGVPDGDALQTGSTSILTDHSDVFKVLDWESLVVFPKTVAFKLSGDHKYLAQRWIEGHPYVQLVSTDKGDQTIANEISNFGDGYVRIRSVSTGNFWRRSPNWVWADSSDTTGGDSDTLFWPVKLADNVVALRNLGNNHYCKILTADGKTSCINAVAPTVTDLARLEVVECVASRSIYNINFVPTVEAKIYDLEEIEASQSHADNDTCSENTLTLTFSYKDTRSSTLGGSVSLKLGVETTLKVSAIPLIVDGEVKLSAEVSSTLEWGKTDSVEKLIETSYSVKVPPMTRTIVTLNAMKGKCDLPFSYTQRDTLDNGGTTIQNLGGIYTGTNMFDFKFVSREEKLHKS